MSTHFRCRCGATYRDLDGLFAHHAAAHGTIIAHATPTSATAASRRGTLAIGKRRADDPYYAARDAARDPDAYDSESEDRRILAQRRAAAC